MKKPKTITTEDSKKILHHLNVQDILIFRVSVETGLRISDVLNLRAWYLDKIMYVQEKKTGKHRIVTLSDDLYAFLRPIKFNAVRNYDKEVYAFPSKRKTNRSIHRTTYHRHLKKACQKMNIDFSAHSTRKLFAQELLKKTGDIFEVQKQLNHKYVADTCLYLDIDFKNLMRAATNPNLLQ